MIVRKVIARFQDVSHICLVIYVDIMNDKIIVVHNFIDQKER